jgi:hypothetical protein
MSTKQRLVAFAVSSSRTTARTEDVLDSLTLEPGAISGRPRWVAQRLPPTGVGVFDNARQSSYRRPLEGCARIMDAMKPKNTALMMLATVTEPTIPPLFQ